MIKTRIAVMTVALSFMVSAASFAANPQLGTWKLDEAKSKLQPGRGKNTMVVYSEQKDKIKVTVDGVDKDGKPQHGVWVGKFEWWEDYIDGADRGLKRWQVADNHRRGDRRERKEI
jgi:hypothetical protein